MKFKSKVATFIGALALVGSTFASQGQPTACPSMSSLQSEGVGAATEIFSNTYITYNISAYDTSNSWIFVMGPIDAETDEDAISDSNDILSTMSGSAVPEMDDNYGSWFCEYETGDPDFFALAVQADYGFSPLKLSALLKRRAH